MVRERTVLPKSEEQLHEVLYDPSYPLSVDHFCTCGNRERCSCHIQGIFGDHHIIRGDDVSSLFEGKIVKHKKSGVFHGGKRSQLE